MSNFEKSLDEDLKQTSVDGDNKPLVNCIWDGRDYAPGFMVCMGDIKMRCKSDGTWENTGELCHPDEDL